MKWIIMSCIKHVVLKNWHPFLHNLFCGFTSNMLCKIKFGASLPNLWHGMHHVKILPKSFHQELVRTENCFIFETTSNSYTINLYNSLWIIPAHSPIHRLYSRKSVIMVPYVTLVNYIIWFIWWNLIWYIYKKIWWRNKPA